MTRTPLGLVLLVLVSVAPSVQASARPGVAVAAKKAAEPVVEASEPTPTERRVQDPVELPPPPRREGTDDEGWTIVQIPNGVFRYQREKGEVVDPDSGTVTLMPRSPLLVAIAEDARRPAPVAQVRRARPEPRRPVVAEEAPCRKERALLAQRLLVLRGMDDVSLDAADLMMTELEGSPSWVASAVLGVGFAVRHPAFPWQPAVIVDGQPLVAVSNVPVGAASVSGADAQVRWRLDDLAKCQARERRDRELSR